MKKTLATLAAAGALIVGTAVPANAYTVHWIKDAYGGRWGTSCPPVVEYHGNGYETVRERRNSQLQGFGLGHLEIEDCKFTGYARTAYYTASFPMYY